MATITNYFEQAQLSMAAYALGLQSGMSGSDQNYIDKLIDAGMSQKQAAEFANTYTVVDQYTEPLLGTGLSATVFADQAGDKYFAIRGTNDPLDIVTDTLIGTLGLSNQYASLKAYYQQLVTEGRLGADEMFSVTGHSLGGFLAQAFAIDYPTKVAQTYTYNAPGFGGAVAELLSLIGVTENAVSVANITNLYAQPGFNLISGLGTVLGQVQPVFIEDQSLISNFPGNHGIAPLTDALALYSLFASVDPSLNADPQTGVQKITAILKAASNKDAKTLESALDALRTLFEENYALGTPDTSATTTPTDDRDSFYANLIGLQDYLKNLPYYDSDTKSLGFTVESLVGQDTAALFAAAQTDIATRYALYKLNPFAVRNATDLYSAIDNGSGALDVYNPATGTGSLTEQYFKDRSAFLVNKLWSGTNDQTTVSGDALALRNSGKQYFDDRATGYRLYLGEDRFASDVPTSGLTQIVFGGENADQITGGDRWDKLYGMSGNDTLQGNKGNDYLEGGRGNDTYVFTSGDGLDTILDTDGLGKITFDGAILNGGNLLFGETYQSADGNYFYTLLAKSTGQDLLISGMGGQIVVKDFQAGELGITLNGTAGPAPTSEFHGTNNNDADLIDTGIPLGIAGGGVLDTNWTNYVPYGQLLYHDPATDVGGMYFIARAGQPYPVNTIFDALYGEAGDDVGQQLPLAA